VIISSFILRARLPLSADENMSADLRIIDRSRARCAARRFHKFHRRMKRRADYNEQFFRRNRKFATVYNIRVLAIARPTVTFVLSLFFFCTWIFFALTASRIAVRTNKIKLMLPILGFRLSKIRACPFSPR